MLRRSAAFFCWVVLMAAPLVAGSPEYSQKALASLETRDTRRADFWMARYLSDGQSDPAELRNFLKRRKLEPGPFLSSRFDPAFLEWFEKGTYPRWQGQNVQENVRTFEIASASKEDLFTTITAAPILENWLVAGDTPKALLLAQGSFRDKPMIYAGKLISGKPMVVFPLVPMELGRHSLHYVWKPEFYDADNDGTPEIWIRYNLAQGDGFAQVLEIYRILDGSSLELLRRFRGENEGVARRRPDGKVEVLTGAASKASLTHREFDQHRVSVYAFENGEFRRVSQSVVAHILKGPQWKEYYQPL